MANRERRGGVGRTVGTFALGAALGSLVALLYAPASGTTTRKRIKMQFRTFQRSAVELRNKAAKKISYAREWMTGRINGGNSKRLKPHPVH